SFLLSLIHLLSPLSSLLFFFNDTATTEIYTLSLHDALPIWINQTIMMALAMVVIASMIGVQGLGQPVLKAIANQYFTLGMFNGLDRKSTRLNSSHSQISYAVFCLKKKKKN